MSDLNVRFLIRLISEAAWKQGIYFDGNRFGDLESFTVFSILRETCLSFVEGSMSWKQSPLTELALEIETILIQKVNEELKSSREPLILDWIQTSLDEAKKVILLSKLYYNEKNV